MEKILTQDEIDALFQASQSRAQASTGSQRPRHVEPCDFHQAGQIGREQVRSVNLLHDSFARSISDSLGAYLRVLFEVNLVSVEQLSYAELLQRIPEVTYMASVNLTPLDVSAALQMDLSLAGPVIDLLLGGQGNAETTQRDLTEIEEQILEGVVHIICRELKNTWQPVLEVSFVFDQRQQLTQIIQLMPPNEKILCLSFEIRMKEARGMLVLVFPAVVSNALLRKLSQQRYYRRRRGPQEASKGLRRRLLESSFPLTLCLPPSPIQVCELMGLSPGTVLTFGRSVREAAVLEIAGRAMFTAFPVRAGNRRGGRVAGRVGCETGKERE